MFDNYLTADQKRSLIEQRITQFAAEGYQHQLNLQIAEVTGDQTAAQTAQDAIGIITTAIEAHEVELGKL